MIHIHTDGSALAYAAVGGWAFVRDDGKSRRGAVLHRGPNQMELWAVLEGLASLPRPSEVTVHTDSKYVISGASSRKHLGEPLWDELFAWLAVHDVSFVKVRSEKPHSHAHHLAREAAFAAAGVAACG